MAPRFLCAGKNTENVARIAGILTQFENPEAARPSRANGASRSLDVRVSAETMAGGLRDRDVLPARGPAAHRACHPRPRDPRAERLGRLLAEKVKPGNLTAPSLIQKLTVSHLRTDAATLRRRLEALVTFGRIEPPGGRRSTARPTARRTG